MAVPLTRMARFGRLSKAGLSKVIETTHTYGVHVETSVAKCKTRTQVDLLAVRPYVCLPALGPPLFAQPRYLKKFDSLLAVRPLLLEICKLFDLELTGSLGCYY